MNGRKILIVEDDESIRESITDLLELEGYTVECARNGENAIQLLYRDGILPHLILLDLMMPIKNGFQFRLEQKKDPKIAHIPVVILSADGYIEEKHQWLGAREYLKKPVDIDVILEVVKRWAL